MSWFLYCNPVSLLYLFYSSFSSFHSVQGWNVLLFLPLEMEGGSYGAVLRTYWINKVTRWRNTTHTGTVSLLLAKIITTILYGSWSQVTRSISDLTYKFRSFLHSRWELFLCDTGRNAFPEETVTACAESLSPEHPRCSTLWLSFLLLFSFPDSRSRTRMFLPLSWNLCCHHSWNWGWGGSDGSPGVLPVFQENGRYGNLTSVSAMLRRGQGFLHLCLRTGSPIFLNFCFPVLIGVGSTFLSFMVPGFLCLFHSHPV